MAKRVTNPPRNKPANPAKRAGNPGGASSARERAQRPGGSRTGRRTPEQRAKRTTAGAARMSATQSALQARAARSERAGAPKASPKITKVAWGRVEVDGEVFKDAKLFPGGAREWDWNETGTQHSPGILPADVEELIEHGATVIVLSQGMLGQLRVSMETMRELGRRKIQVHVLRTDEAVRRYNDLRESEPVGALIHSTC